MEFIIIILLLVISALIAILAKHRGFIEGVSVFSAGIALLGSFNIAFRVAKFGDYSPYAFFSVDAMGALLLLLISCVGFAAVAYSIPYLRKETANNIIGLTRVKQYFCLLNLFLMAMFLAVSSSSPIFSWIAIEATTLSTAFLISFYNKSSSMEAAWKYLIINSIGLLLGFFGTLLYFTPVDSAVGGGFVNWQTLAVNAVHMDPLLAKIAFIFIFIGYGTKVGLAPMHTWLPDAHSKAPAPISALLSGVLLNVALIIVLRFKIITDAVIGQSFSQTLLIVFGLLSVVIAALIIISQKSYKRLLAYSSIENMGIIALGFGFGGLGVIAAILHTIYHSLVKSALFLLSGNFLLKYHSAKIANVKGALKALPKTSILFLIGFLTITGAPPLGMFFSKLLTFSAGIGAHPVVTVISIIFTSIVFIGFLMHVSAMVFGKDLNEETKEPKKESIWLLLPPLALFFLVLFLSFYQPLFLQTLIHAATLRY
ncbi:MAG: Hydrogenase, membrane subunit 1-like protein (EchA-like) [Parcubacteria group bacterium GW2011_GWC2_38_7]|nr:MAG: Hydrogenase, membrane subunit 1-like protein (EchA-like) [Parcubacteria group bacterium GW2011_GWC2_38_7]